MLSKLLLLEIGDRVSFIAGVLAGTMLGWCICVIMFGLMGAFG